MKLGEANYKTWRSDMIDVLLSEELWFIVNGEVKGPGEGEFGEKKAAWKQRVQGQLLVFG